MKIIVDSHFVIGTWHIHQNMPCQDHTRVGLVDQSGYISLSDGCSGGGETDTGSRVLNSAAAASLEDYISLGTIDPYEPSKILGEKIRVTSQDIADSMRLKASDLLATLLYSVITPNGGFIHAFGDGCIIIMYVDGSMKYYELSWKHNMPYYLSYIDDSRKNFIDTYKKDENESFVVKETTILSSGAVTTKEALCTTAKGMEGFSIPITKESLLNIKSIILSSDGMQSFKRQESPSQVDIYEVVSSLTSFKQWKGEFVKRKLSRMLSEFSKKGIAPADDISVAAIHITSEKINDYDTDNTGGPK